MMTYCRYLIILLIITTAKGQQNFHEQQEQKTKLKFRPPADWFSNMQSDQSAVGPNNYEQQNDQPADDRPYSYGDLYLEDYDAETELSPKLPYGIQNVRDVSKFPRNIKMKAPIFQSLCPSRRTHIILNKDSDYEYRPDSYEEVTCAHPFGRNAALHQKNKVCGNNGFSCIQLNRTLFLTRRAFDTECWEVETRIVPAGCECMWPKHHLGDILQHH